MYKFAFVIFSLLTLTLQAQKTHPKAGDFIAPLKIPLYLAGNFGEIRSNHFHAGIDIKTQQREGLPVLAAADGFVSRIKVSLYGYGKAIYIVHPNGLTTTYAHLQKFNPEIEAYVQRAQYDQEIFEIELFPQVNELKVRQGETIALSGNTGGSGGPHLHFEIRETASEIPLNPMLFKFDIQDDVKPILKTLAVYPMNDTSAINGQNNPLYLPLYGSSGSYSISKNTPLQATGVCAFGIEVIDRLNGVANRCGVYSIELKADQRTIYKHEMDAIPFHLSRYINSHVDFYAWKKLKKRVQKSWLQPGNRLNIYKNIVANGQVFFSSYDHQLDYEVKDSYGNLATTSFYISRDTNSYFFPKKKKFILFKRNAPNQFSQNGFSFSLPSGALYQDLHFEYRHENHSKYPLSGIHHIQDVYTPLHKYATVEIPLDSVPSHKADLLLAVSLNSNLRVLAAEGGQLIGDKIRFKTRSFGPYAVVFDTIPPAIEAFNFREPTPSFSNANKIAFKIKDELSGIETFNGFIDNKWVLMEYDRKTGHLWHYFLADQLKRGKHNFKVVVVDERGNASEKRIDFIW